MKNEESFLDPSEFLGIWEVWCLKAFSVSKLSRIWGSSLPIWE